MKKVIKVIFPLLIALVLLGCGLPGDPVIDDIYSQDIYPGTDGAYNLGSEDYRYSDIYGTDLDVSGTTILDPDLTGVLRADGGLVSVDATVCTSPCGSGNATSGNCTWGSINGTVSDQLDLQAELDAKIAKAFFDAAGDLITATADDTPAILSVGADGEVLAADSGVAEGISWIPPPATISQANRSIYVDKEASGAADGTSWADAFTTIQAAVNDLEATVIHAHTIYVRDGTKKTGTADENTLNHLVDDANSQFVAGDVGKRVFNVTDGTWGVVGSFVDAGDVGIVDTAGAALDLFPAGTEDYVFEPTPYRETVYLNGLPATNPAKLILGNVTIQAEYYWVGNCDAQANAGEILDATADFSNVEVGDRVLVWDRNGANTRCQDYEYGTVDDVSQVGSDIVRTTLTKTPTANWEYLITKTEISGSDDGTDPGTARAYCVVAIGMDNTNMFGFYYTFADTYAGYYRSCKDFWIHYSINDFCDAGWYIENSIMKGNYIGGFNAAANLVRLEGNAAYFLTSRCAADTTYAVQLRTGAFAYIELGCLSDGALGVIGDHQSTCYLSYSTILNSVTTGITVRGGTTVFTFRTTNNAVVPESPVGTPDNSSIINT